MKPNTIRAFTFSDLGEVSAAPYDVVVFGGGYAGFAAARRLRAAGRRVLLWEPSGGVVWESGRAFEAEPQIWTPAFQPFAQAVAAVTGIADGRLDGFGAQSVALDLLRTDGVERLYDAMPFRVGLADGLLAAVDAATKSGLRRVRAAQWIDASEAGTLLRLLDPGWRPRPPETLRAYAFWQRFRWPDFQRRRLDSATEWRPSHWASEAVLALRLPGSTERFLPAVASALERLRAACGGELDAAFVSHMSVVPYPEYGPGAEVGRIGPANVAAAVPGGASGAVRTLVERFTLGLEASERLLDAPAASAAATVTLEEPAQAPVEVEAEIAVAGLGTGGAMAAIAAGREGRRVAAFECADVMGGVGVGAGIHSYYYGYPGGLQDEVDDRVGEMMARFAPDGAWGAGFHPEARRVVVEALLHEAGATVKTGARLATVRREGSRIASVHLATPEGPRVWRAAQWIDATGDGDLCALAGCRYRLGRDRDGKLHTCTQSCGAFALEDARLVPYITNPDTGPVDSTDCVATTAARDRGMAALTMPVMNSLNRRTHFTPLLGIRQGRTIETDYALTLDDLVERRAFADGIGCTGSHYDNHAKDLENETPAAMFYVWVAGLWGFPTACEIPYRMLLPAGLDNVWIGCRAAGATEEAVFSFRMQRDILRIGEAAGVAAALACATGADSRDVDLGALRERLGRTGALPPPVDGTSTFGRARTVADWTVAPPPGGNAALVDAALGREGREAGLSLWRVFRDRDRDPEAEARLRAAVAAGAEPGAWRAAAILALRGDPVGLAHLRQVAAADDERPSAPVGAVRADVARGRVAAALLARIGDARRPRS